MGATRTANWPCMDGHQYRGCVGLQECAAAGTLRCWSGHHLSMAGGERLLVEVQVDRYTPSQCLTCANATPAPVHRKSKRGPDNRLMTCTQGHWTGLVSVYNLINHRVPLKVDGHPPCPDYVELAPEDYLNELKAKRESERKRAAEHRMAARTAKA